MAGQANKFHIVAIHAQFFHYIQSGHFQAISFKRLSGVNFKATINTKCATIMAVMTHVVRRVFIIDFSGSV